MKLKKVDNLPKTKARNAEIVKLIAEFEKSKLMFAKVDLTEKEAENIDRAYNSLYQCCKRNTRVKVRRCANTLYLVKVDENGEEL